MLLKVPTSLLLIFKIHFEMQLIEIMTTVDIWNSNISEDEK